MTWSDSGKSVGGDGAASGFGAGGLGAGHLNGAHPSAAEVGVLISEFAAVRVTIDRRGKGPRLLVEDLEGDAKVYLEPLELASFCLANDEERAAWLKVGAYRDDAIALGEAEH